MKKVIEFLKQVRRNNDRDWFQANRGLYDQARAEFDEFVEGLIEGIAGFDPSVRGLTVKDCTYRIYRDTRFSNNKDPYKTHMGAYVCPGGKKSGYAGYYFHVEPVCDDGMIGCNMMTSGIYMPSPDVLRSVRHDIVDNGAEFDRAVRRAKGFVIDEENKLKRLPTGFAPGSPYDEYLKLKDIYLVKSLSNDYLLQPDLVKRVVHDYSLTYDFMKIVNRAVQYALEDND